VESAYRRFGNLAQLVKTLAHALADHARELLDPR
jgi:hypothetical protein